MLPTIELAKKEIKEGKISDAIVISVDDDYSYSKSLIHEFVLHMVNKTGVVVGSAGQNLDHWDFPAEMVGFWNGSDICFANKINERCAFFDWMR